jgi:hypothetical protein
MNLKKFKTYMMMQHGQQVRAKVQRIASCACISFLWLHTAVAASPTAQLM